MQVTKIRATNFLSFKELNYDFENKPILIQGENLSDDSQESNGSGKSALQACIEFALFKTTSRKVRDIELIHFGENECLVQLSINCPMRNQLILIERKVKLKGSGESQLSVNGVVKYAFEDKMVKEIDKFIIEWLGISAEDLQNYFIINKERYKSFFSSSNREKIEMINRFSNAKLIDGVDKEVQVDVDQLNKELDQYKSMKVSIISKVKTLKEQIDLELSRDLKKESEEEIIAIKNKIEEKQQTLLEKSEAIQNENLAQSTRQERIKELQGRIVGNSEVIAQVNKSLEKLNETDYSEQLQSIDNELLTLSKTKGEKNGSKQKLVKSRSEIEEILDEIEKNIKGSVSCPKCNHRFLVGDPDIDIQEEEVAKIQTESLMKETQKSIDAILESIDELNNQESLIYKNKTQVLELDSELSRKKRELRTKIENIGKNNTETNTLINDIQLSIDRGKLKIERVEGERKNIQLEIVALEESIKNTKEKEIDKVRIGEIKGLMRSEGGRLRDTNYSIKRKNNQIFEVSQWIFNFKKFNMFLANQSLKVIQGYCNKFLQDVRSDIQIRWEGIKMLASGALKEEITAYILRDSEQRDFWSFSGGERARMEFAMILTLQRMINQTHKYGGLDFVSIDEVFEGMDAQGLSDLMKSLSQSNKTILLTTHVVNKSIGENILLIRKINGVSTIVKN